MARGGDEPDAAVAEQVERAAEGRERVVRPGTRSRRSASRRRGRTGAASSPACGRPSRPPPTRRRTRRRSTPGTPRSPLAWSEWRCVITTTFTSEGWMPSARSWLETSCSWVTFDVLDHTPGQPPERLVRRDHDRRVKARVHEHPARPRMLDEERHDGDLGPAVAREPDTERPERRQPALLPVHRRLGRDEAPAEERPQPDRGVRPPAGEREGGGPGLGGGRHRRSPYPAPAVAPGMGPADRLGYAAPCSPAAYVPSSRSLR